MIEIYHETYSGKERVMINKKLRYCTSISCLVHNYGAEGEILVRFHDSSCLSSRPPKTIHTVKS